MPPSSPALPPAAAPRLFWIDLLRGWAVLGMIEAHCVNCFLAPVWRTGAFFTVLSYLNGWVAPTFLFVAGYLQGGSLRRSWDRPRPWGPRWRSLGLLLVIAYALQFPWGALRHLDSAAAGEITRALGRIDVLHCLAVTLAGLLLLGQFCQRRNVFDGIVLSAGVLLVAAAPEIWRWAAVHPRPIMLSGYWSPATGALFPIVPWGGYILAGSLASRWERRALPFFIILAGVSALLGFGCAAFFGPGLDGLGYASRPDVFCFRLSLVAVSCLVCAFCWRGPLRQPFLRGVSWCGSRSLGVYVWHLLLLYSGLGIFPPLRQVFPKVQTPGTVVALYGAVLLGTILLTALSSGLTSYLRRRRQ